MSIEVKSKLSDKAKTTVADMKEGDIGLLQGPFPNELFNMPVILNWTGLHSLTTSKGWLLGTTGITFAKNFPVRILNPGESITLTVKAGTDDES